MTLDDIKARCDEVGECWIWKGTFLRGRFPVFRAGPKTLYAKREAWVAHNGKPVPDGMCVVNKKACNDYKCCNPSHLTLATKKQVLQKVVADGKLHTTKIKAKIAKSKRAKSKLSDEAVAEIRYGDEPIPVLAARHGISEGYGYMIRRGDSRQDFSSPFQGLGAR